MGTAMHRLQDQSTTQVYSPFGTIVVESHAAPFRAPRFEVPEPSERYPEGMPAEQLPKAA
jgi:hypothetical protein